jgi:hypothetical protein
MRLLSILILIPFSILTAYTLFDVGYLGLLDYHRHSSAGWQVFTDLVIALILATIWMFKDARESNRSPWPWFAITLFMGSIGPLLYLITKQPKAKTEKSK